MRWRRWHVLAVEATSAIIESLEYVIMSDAVHNSGFMGTLLLCPAL